MPSICHITVNKENEPYFTGEYCKGSISLETFSVKQIKSIRVSILGIAKVKILKENKRESKSLEKQEPEAYCSAYNSYINKHADVHSEGTLNIGTYTFPFSFLLPVDGGTSIEGELGQIRYEIRLQILNKQKYDNIFVRPITVIKHLDLNKNSEYKLPQMIKLNTNSWCLKVIKESVIYTLTTPHCAYVPGQIIKCELRVQNKSSEMFKGYMVELIRKITYTARNPDVVQKCITTELVSKFVADEKDSQDQKICKKIHIPATPPTTLSSNMIFVEYVLSVSARESCFNTKIDLELPIIIGTIPLKESISGTDKFLMETDCSDDNNPSHSALLKPSGYETDFRCESTFVDLDVDEKFRVTNFKPLYPVYRPFELEPREL